VGTAAQHPINPISHQHTTPYSVWLRASSLPGIPIHVPIPDHAYLESSDMWVYLAQGAKGQGAEALNSDYLDIHLHIFLFNTEWCRVQKSE